MIFFMVLPLVIIQDENSSDLFTFIPILILEIFFKLTSFVVIKGQLIYKK